MSHPKATDSNQPAPAVQQTSTRLRRCSKPGRQRLSPVATFVASILLLLVVGALVAACGGSSTSTTAPGVDTTAVTSGSDTTAAGSGSTVQVIMSNRAFDPENVTIKVGDTVTWVNEDAPQHDVVADNGEFKSSLFDRGGSFSFTFTEAGTYPYYCSIHPGMTGTVVVE